MERDTSRAEDDLRRKREIEQLQAEKRRLVGELRALEEQPQAPSDDAQGIPSDTQISLDVAAPAHGGGFELIVATSNETYVVGVVVLDTDGGLFDGETLSCAPARPTDKLGIIVRPKKTFRPPSSYKSTSPRGRCLPQYMSLKLIINYQNSVASTASPRRSHNRVRWVKFDVPTNVQGVAQYLTQAFVSTEAVETEDNQVTSYYVGLDGAPLRVEATKDTTGTQVRISTNDLATAAEVVQDISTSLDVHELENEASFPDESRRLKETLEKVSTHNSIRVRLTAEMADGSSRVKALVLKAEDARLMADMPRMMRNYDELMRVNEGLIAEYNKRATNHEALLAALKQVNQVVQLTSFSTKGGQGERRALLPMLGEQVKKGRRGGFVVAHRGSGRTVANPFVGFFFSVALLGPWAVYRRRRPALLGLKGLGRHRAAGAASAARAASFIAATVLPPSRATCRPRTTCRVFENAETPAS